MKISNALDTSLTPDLFWESVNILVTKPHVVNKRLWGSKSRFKCSCQPKSLPWKLPECLPRLPNLINNENIQQSSSEFLEKLNVVQSDSDPDSSLEVEVLLTELLPKNYTEHQAYQLICLEKDKSKISFFDVTPSSSKQNLCPNFPYSIQLDNNSIVLTALEVEEGSKPYSWLLNTLLPQLNKWGTESINHNAKNSMCKESLSLVSQTKYYEKYNDLKLKYGKEMVKIWPECTDASKFVYEDVAIAAYLLLLWESNGNNKKKFVDLGCGNGLLVFILTKEGHEGIGLDVRKRNIWDIYPPEVILQERTITPSDVCLFPEMDWIIGNHSDELTPWIPVIAARSSYDCNFFLLPCCAYNFDGSKYQRKNSYKSQYNDYLDHIKKLCEDCGFKVSTDRLKIPSTKRICLVSNARTYSQEEYESYCNKISEIIKCDPSSEDKDLDFKAREPVERVRNCTQVDRNVIDSIIVIISKHLLDDCSETNSTWSIGKTAELNELVQLIPKEQLHKLKSECGGLQTLLKNNHNIFEVQSGKVKLRYPKTIHEVSSNPRKRKLKQMPIKVQQKPCWFYNHHPQGCPLSDADCSFLHIKTR